MESSILITGSSGYLGSALCVDLSRDHNVIGLYRRPPSEKLKHAAPDVQWEKGDVVDRSCVDLAFEHGAAKGRRIDYVIHFAAYIDFGENWHDEYYDSNVLGTENILKQAEEAGVKRILFAGSVAAMPPLPDGEFLTEQSPACGTVAYPMSKAMAEKLLRQHSNKVPVTVLRIGGVFTDWCELPPLYSVMKMWSKPFIGRMMPGKGDSGFPYIHRKDLVGIVRKIIEKDAGLDRFETLFASHDGCTYQKELFPIIRKECNKRFHTKPINIPPVLAKPALHAKYVLNTIIKKGTYERAWMINFVDRPIRVDTAYTRKKLDWNPTPGLHILERLPVLMKNFTNQHRQWDARNIRRNEQEYEYNPD
jgi:nucleoside-diphosphate-sugar epimerase